MSMPQRKTNANTLIGATAIIVRRNLRDVINSGDLRPGQKLPGKDIIFVTVHEPMNWGVGLGKKLALFGAPENLPGEPRNFNHNVAEIGTLRDWHGHNGWRFDPQRYKTSSYEDGRFKGYQDGSAIGTWGVPELPILNGNNRVKDAVNPRQNMMVLNRDEKSDFYDTFVAPCHSAFAEWSQACTESRDYRGFVPRVLFPNGGVSWDRKDDIDINFTIRSCVRPVLALELKHLIL